MQPIFYIIIICVVCIAAFILYLLRQKKYKDFVLKNSICLKRLDEINSRYDFYPYVSFDLCHTYDNEHFFDSVSCKDYLIYQLQYIGRKVSYQIDKVNKNKRRYNGYPNEIKSIAEFGQFLCSAEKLKLAKLTREEKKIFRKRTYSCPTVRFSITVSLYRSTINGRVVARKSDSFSADDILSLNFRLNNKSGNFYNDRGIWDAICRVERGKVSNKMRFSILKRDGYRCRKCGVSERFAPLEIDHIMPIAKGGKSTYDNLQTLCHSCNVQKGDTYKKY